MLSVRASIEWMKKVVESRCGTEKKWNKVEVKVLGVDDRMWYLVDKRKWVRGCRVDAESG